MEFTRVLEIDSTHALAEQWVKVALDLGPHLAFGAPPHPGVYFFYDSYIPIAVFLGMHLLFTDPSTSPRTGLGRIMFGMLYGLSVIAAYELQRAGVPFLVLDRSEDRVDRAAQSGILALQGDATRDENLHSAGVTRARGLIAALASDADNLFVILSAKTLNPKMTVVTRASEEEAEQTAAKLRQEKLDPNAVQAKIEHVKEILHGNHG